MSEAPGCEWCGEPTTELTYLQQSGDDKRIHRKCYALMYNYARRFQELKEILMQPDFVEIHEVAEEARRKA